MIISRKSIYDYKNIIQNTNLQEGYQEFIKFFRYLRTYLEKEMKEYNFTNNIVENNMDYSYFQFTNKAFKEKGLKFVVAFVHKDFKYEIWLSGFNRNIQNEYFNALKDKYKNNEHTLTCDSNSTDYILKNNINLTYDYDNLDMLLNEIKTNIIKFTDDFK